MSGSNVAGTCVAGTEPAVAVCRRQLRVAIAGVGGAAILLAACCVVLSSNQTRTSKLAGNWLERLVRQPRAHKKTAAGVPHLESEDFLHKEAKSDSEREAHKERESYDKRPGGEMTTTPAHLAELFDGTPSGRFDPVVEHASVYNQEASGSFDYHVARLAGVDSDGSTSMCGRAEVKHAGKWGSICFRGWTQVFCKYGAHVLAGCV